MRRKTALALALGLTVAWGGVPAGSYPSTGTRRPA